MVYFGRVKITSVQIRTFQQFIFNWWKRNKRDLPWRHTHDPYKIFISEILLQQTQVSRGLPKYIEFIDRYPTVKDLSKAKVADVLKIWKGMGYNRRALYIHQTAKIIVSTYNGKFPKQEDILISFPGLGKYTARAILVFAYKQDVAMIDTNIRQILTHFFFKDIPHPEKEIQCIADKLVPIGKSWEWHQALMDYGAIAYERLKIRKKKVKPYKESNRYFRGRIMDLVREKDWKTKELVWKMTTLYEKDEAFIRIILDDLHKDGLISVSETGIITLPK